MKKLLAIDVGTTAVKAALFDEELNQLDLSISEYTLISGENGELELEPETYWQGIKKTVSDVMKSTGTAAGEIVSVTCDTQGETFIPVDREGRPLHNAVIWLDSRAGAEAEFIAANIGEDELYSHTGLPEINGYLPIAKLKWMKDRRPDIFESTYKFLLLEDYLVFRLSGRFVTNPTIQSSTGYFDIKEGKYWSELLDVCGIPEDMLPEILPCMTVVGGLCESACKDLGLSPDTVVTTGAQDQLAAAVGCGNIRSGIVTDTIGTCQIIAGTYDEIAFDRAEQVSIYAHVVPGKYYALVINQTAGIIQKWFKNEFCSDLVDKYGEADIYTEMGKLAAEEPPLSRGLTLFPYFTGMQGLVSNPNVRGCFIGAGLDTTRGCFIRSIMEGISYMSRSTLELMKLNPEKLIALGGGSKSPLWNQIKADVLNREIVTLSADESALLGAAILGAVAVGLYEDIESANSRINIIKVYSPDADNVPVYEEGYRQFRNISSRIIPLFE